METKNETNPLKKYLVWIIVGVVLLMAMVSYNGHVSRDEAVSKNWSEVLNQYKRRADLIPQLVEVVKGYATHEKDTLAAVTNARASATSFKITPEVLNDPKALARFQEVQGSLAQALSRLMMVSERYPDLKANSNFRDLQAQLEGTENRITVARKRYIDAVNDYNVGVRQLPGKITASAFGFGVKPNFQVENEQTISEAPKITFGTPVNTTQP